MGSQQDSRRDRLGARFHGRVEGSGERCAEPGCAAAGEFRAPPADGVPGAHEGPRPFRWFCLQHVRAFNERYNFFSGMSPDEIHDAQHPLAGWERETRAFATGGGDRPPRWADFTDPLEAISGRFGRGHQGPAPRRDGRVLTAGERRALEVLDLAVDADRRQLRMRYSELVRRFHPDRNGGDRSHEAALGEVIRAYQLLKGSAVFA